MIWMFVGWGVKRLRKKTLFNLLTKKQWVFYGPVNTLKIKTAKNFLLGISVRFK